MLLERLSYGAEDFARLRALLAGAGYTPAGLAERTGSSIMDDHVATASAAPPADTLDALIRLFWNGKALPLAAVSATLPAELSGLLERLGLLVLDAASATARAPYALYPARSVYIVSDQLATVSSSDAPDDVVYPAMTGSTVEFLTTLPETPCERLLDLGTGTGIAALLGAQRHARHAWAVDIAERSTHCALYNARLNDIDNITVLCGDLYAPVPGMTFDRIVAHPPFMPRLQTRLIYGDGGEDGEQITRWIVEGLPDHLRPGGRFVCRCLATDRRDAPLEQRLRAMLGPDAAEFDVAVLARTTMPTHELYGQLLAKGEMTAAAYEQHLQLFRSLGVENMVLCAISMERHAAPQTPLTVRRILAPRIEPQPALCDWLFEWERTVASASFGSTLLDARPTVSEYTEIRLAHHMESGGLRAHGCTITTRYPFAFNFESSPGLALFLGRCDGSHTVGSLFEELKQIGALPPETPAADFIHLVKTLIGGGAVVLPDMPLPPPIV